MSITKKPEPKLDAPGNVCLISIGYEKYVMPQEAGLELVKAFKYAEQAETDYQGTLTKVTPINDNKVQIGFISSEVYKEVKLDTFLTSNAITNDT